MPTSASPASVNPVVRAIVAGQVRHVLTAIGGAAITYGLATQGQVASATPQAVDYIVGTLFVVGPMAWSALSKAAARSRWAPLINTVSSFSLDGAVTTPALLAQVIPASKLTTKKEDDMSIGSELKNVLGIVLGILIPGASKSATNLTTTIQNEIAKVYGEAATAMAKELAVDTTGMSGPDKVFAIVKALVATAEKDGFKGDLKVLGDVAVDIAQAAYRAAEPNFASDIVALASALTANPLVAVAAELVGQTVQAAADAAVAKAA